MDRGFDPAEGVGENRGKKRAFAEAELPGSSVTARHRSWLQRSKASRTSAAWRPRKFYRTSARRWAMNLDSQLRHTTRASGLEFFQPTPGKFPWRDEDWPNWPTLQIALDQGSDGVAGLHSLTYGMGLNIIGNYDSSHGAHKDLDAALAGTSLRQFWILLLVSMNLPHGPFRNDERWHQLRSRMSSHYESWKGQFDPLFLEYCSAIHREAEAAGHQWPRERSVEEEVGPYLGTSMAMPSHLSSGPATPFPPPGFSCLDFGAISAGS